MLSYIIRREERLALKARSWTADQERSQFKPTIRNRHSQDEATSFA